MLSFPIQTNWPMGAHLTSVLLCSLAVLVWALLRQPDWKIHVLALAGNLQKRAGWGASGGVVQQASYRQLANGWYLSLSANWQNYLCGDACRVVHTSACTGWDGCSGNCLHKDSSPCMPSVLHVLHTGSLWSSPSSSPRQVQLFLCHSW